MADYNPTSGVKFARLRQLKVEELEKMLVQGSRLPEDQQDEVFLNAIEEVILEKEQEHPTYRTGNIDESWEEFQSFYLGDEPNRLYPEENVPEPNAKKRPAHKLWKRLVTIAAVFAIVFTSLCVAQAAGVDVFGTVVRWTDQVFIVGETQPANRVAENFEVFVPTPELVKTFEEQGMTEFVFPTRSINGYSLVSVKSYGLSEFSTVDCAFSDQNGHYYLITVQKQRNGECSTEIVYEKDTGNVVEFMHNGYPCYLFSNNERTTAVVLCGPYRITIAGNIPAETIKALVDSI